MKRLMMGAVFAAVAAGAGMIDGIAMTVNDQPITLSQIVAEAKKQNVSNDEATEMLILDKLQEAEIARQNIVVDPFELDSAIDAFAAKNNMTTTRLKEAVEAKMIDWDDYKADFKTKLLRDKLTKKITAQTMGAVDTRELQKYYDAHIASFSVPESINAIQYSSADKGKLELLRSNPLMKPDESIAKEEIALDPKKLNPKLVELIGGTDLNSFTPVLSAGQDYVMFYIQEKVNVKAIPFEDAKNAVYARYAAENEAQTLKDYFDKQKANATINVIRLPK